VLSIKVFDSPKSAKEELVISNNEEEDNMKEYYLED
jgi:hypothetical protein